MRLSNNQSELHSKSYLSNFWGAVQNLLDSLFVRYYLYNSYIEYHFKINKFYINLELFAFFMRPNSALFSILIDTTTYPICPIFLHGRNYIKIIGVFFVYCISIIIAIIYD